MWTAESVTEEVDAQIERGLAFTNMHGITSENLERFRVTPHPVTVDPDDLIGKSREMWIVLREPSGGSHAVVFDPANRSWAVVEQHDCGFVVVVGAETLAQALDGM